jgi:hypothetical protein
MNLRESLKIIYYQFLLTNKIIQKMNLSNLTDFEKSKLEAFLSERAQNINDIKTICESFKSDGFVTDVSNEFLRMYDFNFSNDELSSIIERDGESITIKKICGVFELSYFENRFSNDKCVFCIESNSIETAVNECQAKLKAFKAEKSAKPTEKSVIFI